MKIGLFGGTFDPPHRGHAAICRAAMTQLRLDRLEVVPCNLPPHRPPALAPAEHRLEMMRLATRAIEGVVVSPRELRREGPSYTLTTLRELVGEFPGAELFLILGGDSYDDLPHWYEAEKIQELAHLAVIARPGSEGLARLRDGDRERLVPQGGHPPPGTKSVIRVEMPPCPWSASQLRQQLGEGQDPPPGSVDPLVLEYIHQHGLYGPRQTSSKGAPMTDSTEHTLEVITEILSARKAENLITLDLRGRCSFCDYFVICHGLSERQVKSLADELQHAVRKQLGRRAKVEGYARAEWILMDYGDVIVHIFSESARDFFRLESLWYDEGKAEA